MGWSFARRLVRGPVGPWLLAASAAGWSIHVAHAFTRDPLDGMMSLCSSAGVSPAGRIPDVFGIGIAAWLAMVLAMAPLVLRNEVNQLWTGTFRRRRLTAIAAFAAGYVVPWLMLGLAWPTLAENIPPGFGGIALSIGIVAAWHCAPFRRSLLNACHARPTLRAFGPAMLGDAMRFGVRSGSICCALCGPAMIVAALLSANHVAAMHIVSMGAVTMLVMIERYGPMRERGWQPPWPSRRRGPGWLGVTLPPPPQVPG